MSEALIVECGPADEIGRRSVVATCGSLEYRDRFNTDDAYRRGLFAQSTLNTFGWAVTAEVAIEIDRLVVHEARARDAQRTTGGVQPKVTRLSDVPPSQVEWLWPGRVALGAITMLAGDPGLGKSFVTLDMAARVSRGGRWPEEMQGFRVQGSVPETQSLNPEPRTLNPPASVVLFSAEDDLAKTIRPRLEALGADCDRIVTLEALEGREGEQDYARPFEFGRDLAHLTTVVERLGDCRLVIVDPISAFLGRTSENANAEVRSLLAPLAELASKHNLAVVVVSHLRKEEGAAVYRTMGSMAFVAAARAAWMVIRDPFAAATEQRRLLLPVKNNLAPDAGGLAYSIEPLGPEGAPVVCWIPGSIETPAGGVLSPPRRPAHRPDTERQQVVEWLRELLSAGPQSAVEVREAADAHGYSFATLRRAFRELGGVAVKATGEAHGGWLWQLPCEQAGADIQDEQNSAPVVLSTLSLQGAQMPGSPDVSALSVLGE